MLLLFVGVPAFFYFEPAAAPGTGPKGQLPTLAGYDSIEGEDVWNETGGDATAILETVFQARPDLAVVANQITELGSCAQQNGIANWRVYTDQDDSFATGVVLIASKAQLTNPQAYICPPTPQTRGASLISPCSAYYEYSTLFDTYYVLYSGTKQQVCTDICNGLQDCQN
jgi:hypothetical protein